MAYMTNIFEEVDEDTLSGRYLTFQIDTEYYGIELRYVVEIIHLVPITAIPGLPDYIKGVINLRGKIVPVMDVRLRFGKPVPEYTDKTCIIVAVIDDMDIGFIVDGVEEVLSIPDSDVAPPPEINKTSNKFIKGIGKVGSNIKLLLDFHSMITLTDEAIIAETIQNM